MRIGFHLWRLFNDPQPQKYAHQSKFVLSHSEIGVRRAVAEDKRIRDRAKRFGLKAKKGRHTGWALICRETGGTLVERQFDWQVDEYLAILQSSSTEQKLLQCQVNFWRLKAALDEFWAKQEASHKRLWGDVA